MKIKFLYRILVTSLFLSINFNLFSQNKDSLNISIQFRSLLNETNSDTIGQKIKSLKTRFFKKSDQHKTWYWTELTKYYIQTGKLEQARNSCEQGLKYWNSKKNTSKAATFYNLLGSIESLQKSYKKAIEAYQKAIEGYEKAGNEKAAAFVKNNIANTFFSLSDYESAYKYISKAYQVVKKEKDTLYLPSIAGVLAVSEVKLGKFDAGKKHADECLHLSQKYGNVIGLIIGNYTLGEYWNEQKKYPLAISKFQESLDISTMYKQAFYMMLCNIGLANAANENKNFDLALSSSLEALKIAEQLENQNTLYSIHRQLARAYFGKNNSRDAYKQLNMAHTIFRSNVDKSNREIINDILIKYETAQKEKEIVAAKLKLQEEKVKSNQLFYLTLFLILGVIITVLTLVNLKKLQKQKLRALELQKNESVLKALVEGEERERERISNELHDGVASAITGIKIGLETIQVTDSYSLQKTMTQLKNLHEETRRISHNLMPLKLDIVSFTQAIHRFCQENSSDRTNLHFYGSEEHPFPFSQNIAHILYRISQELVNNTLKHAQAKNCTVQIQVTENTFSITFEDDGIGFDLAQLEKSQGLKSIEQRMLEIGGTFHLETAPGKGCFTVLEFVF